MTRQERIQELKNQIDAKRHEITELKEQLDSEMVSDFHETNNLREGQHFIYDNKECVGVKCEDGVLKTFRIKKDGTVSKMPTIIWNKENVKAI